MSPAPSAAEASATDNPVTVPRTYRGIVRIRGALGRGTFRPAAVLGRGAAEATDGPLRQLVSFAAVGAVGWVGHRMGDYAGYFRLQSGAWAHEWDFGRQTLDVLTSVPVGHSDYLFAWPFADMIGVGVVLLALLLLPLLIRVRLPAVLIVHTLLTLVLVLGSQQIFGNVSRYLLPLFPLFIPVALALRRLGPAYQFTLLGVAALASGSYAGYGLFELGVP
jgi:hypothetical protein